MLLWMACPFLSSSLWCRCRTSRESWGCRSWCFPLGLFWGVCAIVLRCLLQLQLQLPVYCHLYLYGHCNPSHSHSRTRNAKSYTPISLHRHVPLRARRGVYMIAGQCLMDMPTRRGDRLLSLRRQRRWIELPRW